MTTSIKQFFLNANDIQFVYDQVKFPTIVVIGYDDGGKPIFGLSAAGVPAGVTTVKVNGQDASIAISALDNSRVIPISAIYAANGQSGISGGLGTFNPLDLLFYGITYTDPATQTDVTLPYYTSARDYEGLRNVAGEFNNLIDGQSGWGSANEQFLRLVDPDYSHYSQEVMSSLSALPSATAGDFAALPGDTASLTTTSDTAHAQGSISLPGGPTINWYEWDRTADTTTTTVHLISGQHKFVDQVQATATKTAVTDHWVQDGDGAHQTTSNTPTVLSTSTGYSVAGGELDTTTLVKFDVASSTWVLANPGDSDAMVAHDFHGVTNGVTTPADYSDPLADVVDYTPRMITQTISSSYNQTDSALERLGIATDSATYDIVDINGNVTTPDYTEHFIENTNSYAADPSYSGWFVLFGQFFDHGLDFIQKPGGGPTIQIALAVDDPLYGTIGPDGNPVTSLTISRATPTFDANGVAQYQNTDSPYIDQNQTYGATDQISLLLREWVEDPNDPGHYIAGASLLDGHTVQSDYLSPVFADQGTFNADGQGLTNRTLPTLNELRAALAATGRDDITWEDIANYRVRDASGHIYHTTGGDTVDTGQAIVLDMLPRFDAAHIDTAVTSKLAMLGATNITFVPYPNGTTDVQFTYTDVNNVQQTTTLYTPGNINPANNSITATDANLHAIIGELFLESIGDHYVAGDGRANENFGLTTIHHVFHEDHNVQLINLEATVLGGQDANPDKAHAWQVKVLGTNAQIGATSGDVSTADALYTGVNYHFENLRTVTDSSGTYFVADLTDIRDSRGNIITTDGSAYDNSNALTVHDVYVDASGYVSWNQDMMFDAAKLIVEMEYQHVAIDQYARFVTPDLPEFVTYDANINADISLEYAQAAFRFGHSQLRETIDAIETQGADHSFDVTGNIVHYALSAAFLNPEGFAEVGPSAIALGMTHQVGNETDEFVTSALQQSLLGQPLDLGAINIARGRDVGLPTLNEVRKQLYDALVAERANTNGPASQAHAKIQLDQLKPYNSWSEFGNSMIHSESLVNFIAAYSFDGDVAHAQAVLDADAGNTDINFVGADGLSHAVTAVDAHAFMSGTIQTDGSGHAVVDVNGDPVYAVDGAGGFNNVDLWIGGLAESHVLGGILGPTFNAIFEDQLERLMDGDRFYYLYRLFLALPEITNLNSQITNEQFKDIVERTSGVTHLNGDIMLYADSYVELGHQAAADAASEHKYGDVLTALHASGALGAQQGVYSSGGASTGGNGNVITIADPEHSGQYLSFVSDIRPDSPDINSNGNPTYGYNSHEVLSGTDFNDYLDTGDGDDTSYGGKGDDILVGNGGSDHLYGEDGNDVLYGAGGTAGADVADFLDGGAGDDYIYGGQNAGATEVLIGGSGNDHIYGEAGIDELYGDEGDDYIDAGGDTDLAFGGGGNDEMYGGEGPDELHGNAGDDLLSGGSGSDVLVGEEGDDILFGGQGGGAAQGDSDELIGGDLGGADTAFDLADYSDSSITLNVAADLNNQLLQGTPAGVAFEPFNHLYQGIDGLVGTKYDDAVIPTSATTENPRGNPYGAGLVGDDNANWLIGGSGNDIMQGQGSNDVVVGDSIKLADLNSFLGTVGFDQHFTDLQTSRPDFLIGDGGTAGTADQATFTGNLADYTIEALDAAGNVVANPHGNWVGVYAVRVTDSLASRTAADGITTIPGDGTDILIGVEQVRFADQTISPEAYFDVAPTLDLNYVPVADINILASDNFNGSGSSYSRGAGWNGSWTETNDTGSSGGAGGGDITDTNDRLNFGNTSTFGGGNASIDGNESVQRVLNLSGQPSATLVFDYNMNDLEGGKNIIVEAWNATTNTWDVLHSFLGGGSGVTQSGTFTVDLTADQISSASAIQFRAEGSWSGNDRFWIDNVQISTPAGTFHDGAPGNNYTNPADYIEQQTPAAVTAMPLIADPDDSTIASATIHIRDAVAGDILTVGSLPAGITATGDGTGTVTLSGVASHADYQTALAAIIFSNPSNDNPTGADRHIDVTVNDGLKDSAVATTTISVTPVDDAATALAADSIVTNYGTGTNSSVTVIVPDWALATNDTDLDGVVISGASGASGLANLSHSSGAVSFRDSSPAGGSFNYSSGALSAHVTVTQDTSGSLDGTNNAEIIIGNGSPSTINALDGSDVIIGGGGNDTINADGGDDTIYWSAHTASGNSNNGADGRDIIDGGANATSHGDTFIVDGSNSSEAFSIYTAADWLALGGTGNNGHTLANNQSEIVITRGTNPNNGDVIAELRNVEEIVVNTNGGNDTVVASGNFDTTHLNYSTITINDDDGGDKVDISGLTSDHRIVFHTDATGQVIGDVRPQDVVDQWGGGQAGPMPPETAGGPNGPGDETQAAGNDSSDPAQTDTGGSDPVDDDQASASGGNGCVQTEPGTVVTTGAHLVGGAGDDTLIGDDTTSVVHAGDGADVIMVGDHGVVVDAGAGDDVVATGAGADVVFGGVGNDVIDTGGGNDMIWGGDGDDLIKAGDGDDLVWGGDGNNEIHAGAGDDRIEVGQGANILWGDAGNDTFVFRTAQDADGATIADLQTGDTIDLHFIDADASTAANDAFQIASGNTFTAAGQLIVHYDAGSSETFIDGNTDANVDTIEFHIAIAGNMVDQVKSGAVIV